MTRPAPHSSDVEEAAALWYARMNSELKTPQDRAAFDAWLNSAPAHAEAYADICALSGRFELLSGRAELASLKVQAQQVEENRRSFLSHFGGVLVGAGVASAAAAGALIFVAHRDAERQDWATANEILTVTLRDGTKAVIGPNTRMQTVFLRDQRLVEIRRGQVFFDVAHDARRPFVAAANGRTIVALGTAFDVRAFQDDLTVTLLRGRVAVAREGQAPEAILEPGEQFRARLGAASVTRVDASAEVAWRSGVYDFRDVTLSEAVARFNNSTETRLILADPGIGAFRVSGVFRISDPAGFAAALTPAYPVRVRHLPSGDILLERAD